MEKPPLSSGMFRLATFSSDASCPWRASANSSSSLATSAEVQNAVYVHGGALPQLYIGYNPIN